MLRGWVLLCLLDLASCAVSVHCSGKVAEPIIQKDGDFMLIGIFDVSKKVVKDVTVDNVTQETWTCEEDSIYSLERALAFSWTVEEMRNLSGGYTLGYAIYQVCQSRYLTRHVATTASYNNKVVGALAPGNKDYMQSMLGPTSSGLIPTAAYIYSDDSFLDQDNYPHYFSLIDSEEQEAMGMITFLKEMDYRFVDIWYHSYSYTMADYIYKNYVSKVGCGRMTKYSSTGKTSKTLLKSLKEYYGGPAAGPDVRSATVQLLLFNTYGSTKLFLNTVTDPNGTYAWKDKIYIMGFTNSRYKYAHFYQDILSVNMNGTDSDDLLFLTQSPTLNTELPETEKRFYEPTATNELYQKFMNMRKCDNVSDCDVKTTSWTPYVILGTKILSKAVEDVIASLDTIPCIQTLRTMVYDTLVRGGYSVTVEGIEFKNVSFSDSTFSGGYQMEVWRRSYSLTERRTMGSVSFASSVYNKTLVDSLRSPILQKWCSEDCGAGWSRKFTNVRYFPCCWECERCMLHSFSNLSNSDTCVECEDNEKSNEGRTFCERVKDEFIKASSLPFIIGSAGMVLVVSLILFVFVYVVKEETRPIIKASDPIFCYMFLSSLVIGAIGGLVCLTEPSVTACQAEYACALVFFSLVTSTLSMRCTKIYSVFQAAENFSKPKFGPLFTSKGQVISNSVILFINIAVCVPCVYFEGWHYDQYQEKTHVDIYLICSSGNSILLPLPFALPGILFLATLVLAFKMRKFPHNFNETSNIFMATLVVLMGLVFFMTGYKFSPFNIKAMLRSVVMFLTVLAFLFCLFIPKLVVLLKRGDIEAEKAKMKAEVQEYSGRKSRVSTVSMTR